LEDKYSDRFSEREVRKVKDSIQLKAGEISPKEVRKIRMKKG
jgi:hypothetical protein